MTREEAIENIKGILEEATQYKNAVCYVTSVDEEPLKMAIADMEKQIPKKPKKQIRGVYDDDNGDYLESEVWNMCPSCKRRNEVYRGWDFCTRCGQALDWTEEDEPQNVDRCVCCGEVIPEGRQVCINCERKGESE